MCPAILPSPTHLELGSCFGLILRQFLKHLTRARKNFCLLGQGDLLKNLTHYFSTSHSFKVVIAQDLRGAQCRQFVFWRSPAPQSWSILEQSWGWVQGWGARRDIPLQVRTPPLSCEHHSTEHRDQKSPLLDTRLSPGTPRKSDFMFL